MLDLEFDQEQEMLRQTVRDVLARHCPLERGARRWRTTPSATRPTLWTQLGELDLIGLLLPEEYGGSGMSLVEGVVLYEELGRALAPVAALRERGPGRRRAGRGGERRPEGRGGCAPVAVRRGHPHPGLARARERVLAPRRRGAGRRPTVTGSGSTGVKRHVAFAVGRRPARRAGPHRRRRPTPSTSSWSTPPRRG